MFVPLVAAAGGALPAGGHYVAGKGAIGGSRTSLTINQSSTTGIIDWNSFSIGKSNAVVFNNGSGATLNQVTGGNLSTIAGSLHASGSVYLINPEGVIVSGTGRIVTGGNFGASTQGPDGKQHGNIVDAGSITSAHGSVSLTGKNVSVPGYVTVMRGGHVWLVSSGTTSISGTVSAQSANGAGGSIVVRGTDIDMSGTVNASAKAAGQSGGTVSIIANGTDTVTGTIEAKGGVGGRGGAIETSGHILSVDGSTVDAGNGGTWLLDPYDLTVDASAATTIDESLNAGTNVTLQTTATGTSGPGNPNSSGNGDIFIDSALSWSTGATLTMSAYRNIDINAPITVSGAGGLVLTTGTGTSGSLSVDLGPTGFGGNINYGSTNNGGTLTINGISYTLIYSMSALQNINASSAALAGNYALATSLNASGTTSWTPIGTDGAGDIENSGSGFTGNFEGLGNTISNLSINLPSVNDVGLFGYAGASGTSIRDIGMVGGSVTGSESVGSLAGAAWGAINYDYSTESVSGLGGVGGLIGVESYDGSISNSYATGAVSGIGDVAGLVGNAEGPISNSYATGMVTGTGSDSDAVGGLSGESDESITSSYATGAVVGDITIGGLTGGNGGTITNSFATGSVTLGGTPSRYYAYAGGLAGFSDGPISGSYSTGWVREENG